MRLFLAVALAAELQSKVGALIDQFSATSKGVKWIDPCQAHFTLFFLGEQPRSLVARLDSLLKTEAAAHRPFLLSLGQGGVFPAWQNPRVLWLGVEQGRAELMALAAGVTAACLQSGLPKLDRPFAPHLTLGRVKKPPAVFDQRLLQRGVTGEMRVDGFTLFASELRPQGPLYRELVTYPLGIAGEKELHNSLP